MPSFNQVTLMGHLTRDPSLKFLPSQTALCEFGLAVNHKYKTAAGEQKEEVCFVDCTAFGKGGEVINQYVQKGAPLFVVGRLKFDSWEDKQGGGKRSKLSVVVDNFQFLGGRNDGGGQGSDGDRAAGTHRPATRPGRAEQRSRQERPEPPFGEEQQFAEADIPF